MPTARLTLDSDLAPAAALARGYALLAGVCTERPALLYGASLADSALVLGAYQHAPHALNVGALDALALPVLRRRSGGATVWAGAGVLYFALGLNDASVLMACPRGKILNRNVRGFLAGLRTLGVPAHYFGRDFVSLAMQPSAYVGWEEAEDGRVLLEFFLGLDTVFTPAPELSGYPERKEPALRGKTPVTLASALPEPRAPLDVLRAIANGYARGFGLELEEERLREDAGAHARELAETLHMDPRDAGPLTWSAPYEEAIGFVGAGVRLDSENKLAALRLAGDFFAARNAEPKLAASLIGREPTPDVVGAALDGVYAQPGALEGVRSLGSLQRAILEAVGADR